MPTVNELLDGDAPRIRAALAFGSLAPWCSRRRGPAWDSAWSRGGDPFEHFWVLIRHDCAPFCSPARPSRRRRSVLCWPLKSDVAPTASAATAAALYATLPAVAVALTSPEVFFKAMDFAGAYPVAILWGVFPPLACLKLRRTTSGARTAGPDVARRARFCIRALRRVDSGAGHSWGV